MALLSRRTLQTIEQNIGISVVYNPITVSLAMAVISIPINSLLVIGNAAGIRALFKGAPLE